MAELDAREFNRRRRVVDTMLTAHATLGERYGRWARGLTLLIMGLSIVATGVAFVSSESDVTIGPFTGRVQVLVGLLTCVIFFLSIVDLLVEWRRRAWGHDEAVRRLADLKAQYRRAHTEHDVTRSELDLVAEYDNTMDALDALRVPIPDAKFNRLKARHWRKVELSKRISARPQRPLLLHRLDILREGLGTSQPPSPPPSTASDPPHTSDGESR